MASRNTPKPRVRKTPAAVETKAATGDADSTVVAKTANATIPENPASTTSAADPELASTVPEVNTATAQAERDAVGSETGAKPNTEIELGRGEYHSHPAETTAERSVRLAGVSGDPMEFPAGDDADPAAPINQSMREGDKPADESSQDESGALQTATREAIGAGYGAPDGIADEGAPTPAGADSSADVEPVELEGGFRFTGNKAKLWRLLEAGATHDEMRETTAYVSALGTVYSMAAQVGREVHVEKKDGVRTYSLVPLETK